MSKSSIPNCHCAVKPHPLAELLLLTLVPIIRAFVSIAPLFDTRPYPQTSVASLTPPRELPVPVRLSPDQSLEWGKLSSRIQRSEYEVRSDHD